jgi:hypothetical protein
LDTIIISKAERDRERQCFAQGCLERIVAPALLSSHLVPDASLIDFHHASSSSIVRGLHSNPPWVRSGEYLQLNVASKGRTKYNGQYSQKTHNSGFHDSKENKKKNKLWDVLQIYKVSYNTSDKAGMQYHRNEKMEIITKERYIITTPGV